MTTPTASSGPSIRGWRLAESPGVKGIEVIGEYSENELMWMELTGGARGVFMLGSGLRMRPRFP